VGPDGVSKYYRAPRGAGAVIIAACRSTHLVQSRVQIEKCLMKRLLTQHRTLEGQTHEVAAEALAPVLRTFFEA
jgi:hypothetical protein